MPSHRHDHPQSLLNMTMTMIIGMIMTTIGHDLDACSRAICSSFSFINRNVVAAKLNEDDLCKFFKLYQSSVPQPNHVKYMP